MRKIQIKEWRRMNPDFIKEMDYRFKQMVFDGDHALCNEFSVRGRFTIQDMIQSVQEREVFIKEKKLKEEAIEAFKAEALANGMTINLKEATDDKFFSSQDMNEFWRVCYELSKDKGSHNSEEEPASYQTIVEQVGGADIQIEPGTTAINPLDVESEIEGESQDDSRK